MNGKKMYYGTGRRKQSVARVFCYDGHGERTINGVSLEAYFKHTFYIHNAMFPASLLNLSHHTFSLYITVEGGGISGQSDAVKLGLSRALLVYEADHPMVDESSGLPLSYKTILKKYHLLTRDPRRVERKKPGLKKARKASQFSKR
jgi:small subunit ribosomal protein S9